MRHLKRNAQRSTVVAEFDTKGLVPKIREYDLCNDWLTGLKGRAFNRDIERHGMRKWRSACGTVALGEVSSTAQSKLKR